MIFISLKCLRLTINTRPSLSIEIRQSAPFRAAVARGAATDPTGHVCRARKFQRDRPLRALNRGTGAPGVGDVDAIGFHRKRRRTQEEVHMRRPTLIGEWTSDGGTENTSCGEFRALRVRAGLRSPRLSAEADNSRTKRTQLVITRFARHTGTVSIWTFEIENQSKCLYAIMNRQRETGSAAVLRHRVLEVESYR